MAGWTAAAIVGSAVIGAGASRQAAKSQERAAAESTAAQERMFAKQVELQEPFRKVGVNALPELVAASKYEPFTMAKYQADPGYGFRLREGMKALERSAAARGGLLSGATLRGVQEYGQDLASQEYTNAFNRYQAERAARLNPLQSLTGMGQTTAANVATQAGQLGQNVGANLMAGGAARASGYVGAANALTGAIGQGLNYYQNQQMLNRFFPQQQRTPYNQATSLQNWGASQAGYLDPDYMGP
jgi:hypothetical protein